MEPQTTEQNDDLARFRMKLWDKFCTIRETRGGIDTTFDVYWYDFLTKHYMSNGAPIEETFRKFCKRIN
jgi:hypothetical protein